MSGLRTRLLSALVLLPAAVAVVLLGGWLFAAAVAALAVLMLAEWMGMVGEAEGAMQRAALPGAALAVAVLAMQAGWTAAAFALLAAAGVAVAALRPAGGPWGGLGILWIGLPCVLAVWLREHVPNGGWAVLWVLATVWAMDSGAYFAGRRFGGPLLAPRISPKKTWSGLLGGLAAAGLAGAVAGSLAGGALLATAALSVLLAGVSHVGDLAESAVKRHFHRKDSGTLIPGHGGVLDRMDAQLFALPCAALLAALNGGMLLPWR